MSDFPLSNDVAAHALAPLELAGDDGSPRPISVHDVAAVARARRRLALLHEDEQSERNLERAMRASAEWVDATVAATATDHPAAVYGINTGFGALAGRQAFNSPYLARVLSRNLLVSHAAGTGAPLAEDVVRAAAFIRATQLAQGRSGIRISVVNRLLALLNADLYPVIPEGGSLGASGDLAPLAHLALVISAPPQPGPGDRPQEIDDYPGQIWLPIDSMPATHSPEPDDNVQVTTDHATGQPRLWRRSSARDAMAHVGGQIELGGKEGLALNNGATFSAALLALAVVDAESLLRHAELAVAMTLEAIRGFRDAFLPEVHDARPHPGARSAAARILSYVDGSSLVDRASRKGEPVRVPPQDPYSIRCAPQVIGAGWDALEFARRAVEIEINSAVDNPLVFVDLPRAYKAVSCGNFHGAPLGYALDLLKIALTDCAGQSERRTFKLTDYRFDDPARRHLSLPMFLTASEPGLEGLRSGLMIPQYTAAALVSAAKTLAHPDSVDSIPSSANQEDHVSMSMNAGLHARRIAGICETVLAIELLTAAQALEFRRHQGDLGQGTTVAYDLLRTIVPPLTNDRPLYRDIDATVRLLRSGRLLEPLPQ